MKIIYFLTLVFAFCLFQPQMIEAQRKRPVKKTTNTNLTARQIADKILPSVVLIITQDENGNPISQGSGFVIGSGLVVSNLHVFERATNAIVKNVKTGEISKAIEVVGMNAREDICVIRIDNTKFPALSLGDSSSVKTGDEIYVASNPKGLEGSFTKGIISGLRSEVGLFQIDAAISSGSSGGVLLNQKAEAIGIVKSSLVGGQNLNFAIPINKLKNIPLKSNFSILLAGACAYKDRDRDKLKGFVKSVREKSRYKTIKDGKFYETEPVTNSIAVYDFEGKQIEYHVYSVEGVFIFKYLNYYDENKIKSLVIQEGSNGQRKEIKFDLEQGIYNKLYNRQFSGEFEYENPKGKRIHNSFGEMTVWYIGGKKTTYSYDSDGRMSERIQWGNDEIEHKHRYRYKEDKNGNWFEQKEYSNFLNANVDPNKWFEGETTYREITYYE